MVVAMLMSNVLAALGVFFVLLAVGMLAGVWWSVLGFGVVLLVAAWASFRAAQVGEVASSRPLKVVKAAA